MWLFLLYLYVLNIFYHMGEKDIGKDTRGNPCEWINKWHWLLNPWAQIGKPSAQNFVTSAPLDVNCCMMRPQSK